MQRKVAMHVISEYVNHEYIGLARELTLQKLLSMLIAAAQLEQAPGRYRAMAHSGPIWQLPMSLGRPGST